ncbi:MAG: hypothetical protein WCJ95_11965, partial [Mariniphaga sp.]
MKKFSGSSFSLIVVIFTLITETISAQQLADYSYNGAFTPLANSVRSEVQFNGYTNYWHNDYKEWFRYGNLFKMAVPNVANTIAQSKIDVAEDMQLPGLSVQEGFVSALFASTYKTLEAPSLKEFDESLNSGDLLVFTDPATAVGKKLGTKFVPD